MKENMIVGAMADGEIIFWLLFKLIDFPRRYLCHNLLSVQNKHFLISLLYEMPHNISYISAYSAISKN